MDVLRNLLIFAGCATFSLYLFPVGGVQPAHALLAMAAFVAILNERIQFSTEAMILLALSAVAFGRETAAVLGGSPTGVIVQPIYILFNLTVLVAVQTDYFETRSIATYKWGIAAATLIALASILASGIDLTGTKIQQRAIGTFQNPNQLAYFSAIMFSMTALLYAFERISATIAALLIVSVILLAMAAQSKAGFVGLSLGLCGLLASRKTGRILAVAGVFGVAILHFYSLVDFSKLLFLQRLQDIGGDPDDSFAARGYLVLVEHARDPLEVWFGLGAHGVRIVNYHEIHSTYASYFGLYGIVGGLLYLAFLGCWLWKLFRALPLGAFAAVTAPPLFYGIAHNGTRFSIFYALISLSLALCEERRSAMRQGRTANQNSVLTSGFVRGNRIRPVARIARWE